MRSSVPRRLLYIALPFHAERPLEHGEARGLGFAASRLATQMDAVANVPAGVTLSVGMRSRRLCVEFHGRGTCAATINLHDGRFGLMRQGLALLRRTL